VSILGLHTVYPREFNNDWIGEAMSAKHDQLPSTEHQGALDHGRPRENLRLQRAGAWTGPIMTVLFFVAFVPLARFLPPPSPAQDAGAITAFYNEHTGGIRVGFFLVLMVAGMFLTFGTTVAARTRRIESRRQPLMTYLQLTSMAVCAVIAVFCGIFWEAAAYRPGMISTDVTQALNDLGWFTFLWPWVPFSVWCIAIAIPIFEDNAATRTYPRWVAYMNLWTALLYLPAGFIVFTKTGPLAWNGVLAFYIPLFVFFIWVVLMSVTTLQSIRRQIAAVDAV
jgi:hypothetical protein